jgi:hypothetical protein
MPPTREAVLLLAFNRPDRLRSVVDAIRPDAPPRVYLAVDGPRSTVAEDAERVRLTQGVVGEIDWDCEVRTLFREENLGCGRAVSGGIDWFFSQESSGVILEDDLIPGPDFLRYCDAMLDRYRDDPRVFAVSGCNLVPQAQLRAPGSYRFSGITHVWGWATWQRAWQHYRFDLTGWRERLPVAQRLRAVGGHAAQAAFWTGAFELVRRGHLDTWDHQFILTTMEQGGLTVSPNVNLVENAGFDADSTHMTERPSYLRPIEPLAWPLVDAPVLRDVHADNWEYRHVFGATALGLGRAALRRMRARR